MSWILFPKTSLLIDAEITLQVYERTENRVEGRYSHEPEREERKHGDLSLESGLDFPDDHNRKDNQYDIGCNIRSLEVVQPSGLNCD